MTNSFAYLLYRKNPNNEIIMNEKLQHFENKLYKN